MDTPKGRTRMHRRQFLDNTEDTQKILRHYVEFYVDLVLPVGCIFSTMKEVRPTSDTPLEMAECAPKNQRGAVGLTGFDPK